MYDLATYFAWFVLALLFCLAIAMIVAIGSLPKKIATQRHHPQVAAINAASWIGLCARRSRLAHRVRVGFSPHRLDGRRRRYYRREQRAARSRRLPPQRNLNSCGDMWKNCELNWSR